MENLIKKIYEQKMHDGSFEKIISDEFDNLTRDACHSLFSYSGDIRKEMESKLKEVMGSLIETTDFSNYVTKVKFIINETLKNTSAVDYKEISESLRTILGQKHIKLFSVIKASELFEKYCDFISNKSLSNFELTDDVIDNAEEGVAYLDCEMELDKCNNVLHFKCDGIDNNDCDFEIPLGSGNRIIYRPEIYIEDYEHINDFICYLIMLSNNFVKIEFDVTGNSCQVDIEIED